MRTLIYLLDGLGRLVLRLARWLLTTKPPAEAVARPQATHPASWLYKCACGTRWHSECDLFNNHRDPTAPVWCFGCHRWIEATEGV